MALVHSIFGEGRRAPSRVQPLTTQGYPAHVPGSQRPRPSAIRPVLDTALLVEEDEADDIPICTPVWCSTPILSPSPTPTLGFADSPWKTLDRPLSSPSLSTPSTVPSFLDQDHAATPQDYLRAQTYPSHAGRARGTPQRLRSPGVESERRHPQGLQRHSSGGTVELCARVLPAAAQPTRTGSRGTEGRGPLARSPSSGEASSSSARHRQQETVAGSGIALSRSGPRSEQWPVPKRGERGGGRREDQLPVEQGTGESKSTAVGCSPSSGRVRANKAQERAAAGGARSMTPQLATSAAAALGAGSPFLPRTRGSLAEDQLPASKPAQHTHTSPTGVPQAKVASRKQGEPNPPNCRARSKGRTSRLGQSVSPSGKGGCQPKDCGSKEGPQVLCRKAEKQVRFSDTVQVRQVTSKAARKTVK